MSAHHTALAILISIIWGCAFVATKLGLQSFTPSQLTALRFLIACLPAIVLRRPALRWTTLLGIGLTLFAGQFLLLFFAMELGLPRQPMLPFMVWLSLVPPLPALVVSYLSHDGEALVTAITHASWISLASAIYLGAIATVAAYTTLGKLLARYSAAQVAPFALIAPCAWTVGSWLVFGEVFGPLCYVGMVLILVGVAVTVLRRADQPVPIRT